MISKLLIWLGLRKEPNPLENIDGQELGRQWMEGTITGDQYWDEVYRRGRLGKRG